MGGDGRNLGSGEAAAEGLCAAEDAHLVVAFAVDEGVEYLSATFDDDTLQPGLIERLQGLFNRRGAKMQPMVWHVGQTVSPVEHHGLRYRTKVVAGSKAGMIPQVGLAAHEDGGFLGAPAVVEAVLMLSRSGLKV